MKNAQQLSTLPQLAKRFGCSIRQAEYAATTYGIEPAVKIANVRAFDESAATQLRSALGRTGALPPVKYREAAVA